MTNKQHHGWSLSDIRFDDEQTWREEAFGERPALDALGDPFHDDEPLECGLEDPETCESCE